MPSETRKTPTLDQKQIIQKYSSSKSTIRPISESNPWTYLDVALWLHESPHDAEGAEEGSVVPLGGQAGDDGVVGPLGRGKTVGVALYQREVGTPVLQ